MSNENWAKIKYGGWGVVVGAVIAMIVGFTWGGWVTTGTADEMSDEAVLASRAAICVAQFMKEPDQEERLKAFQETDSWKRSEFVSQGGWDRMPGDEESKGAVTHACARGIAALLD